MLFSKEVEMSHTGLGVMINYLRGNKETVESIQLSLGKIILKAELDGNDLKLHFEDSVLRLFDDGQSCCESRYMVTDDNLSEFSGAKFTNIEIKDAPSATNDGWGEHEIQFLEITTDKGSFVMSNHNEHNGYYGGFSIVARII